MKKKKSKPTTSEIASETKNLYDQFLINGFNTEQAFQLTLAVLKSKVK